jgi:hypothetical protein
MSYTLLFTIAILLLTCIGLPRYFKEKIKIFFEFTNECFNIINGQSELSDDEEIDKSLYYMDVKAI